MRAPVKGRVTSGFGSRVHPITGKRSFHNGVDIAVPIGTPVLAPENGRICEVWDHPKGGKCIAMKTTMGTRYGFAHLSQQSRKVGDLVFEGDTIALSGNTGASTGAHVHFTVKKGELWMDPARYFHF